MPQLARGLEAEVRIDDIASAAHEPGARARSVQPVTPRLICVVSGARSGTNHLCSVLSRISEIDVRHEIFHKIRCQKLNERELAKLSHRLGKAFPPDCASPATVSAVRRHPGLVMDCLTELMAPEKRLLCFKVFRQQLSVRQVRDAFIRRPDAIMIFLRRRPIDTFVSVRKALHLQDWHGRDTTDVKISIDADDFIGWWGRASAWFRQVEAACWAMNKPFHRLTYEDDVDVPADKILDRFRGILASHGVSDLTVSDNEKPSDIKRQDRNKEVSDRVANWSEFEQRLRDKGFLERAFSPFPHYVPTAWDRLRHRLGTLV
ncbi:sulfotransferase [Dongia deserti]|uniref:sulfotransferase n=1 Tax=Dongia deserti TaxID=2268030 RepID=UPI000E659536|nr:sulfotransferase [Dongia deserti]